MRNVLFTEFGTFFGSLQISFNHSQFTGDLYDDDFGCFFFYFLLVDVAMYPKGRKEKYLIQKIGFDVENGISG